MSGLPIAVRQALDAMLAGRQRDALSNKSQAITAAYRVGRNSSAVLLSDDDALAYAVARMPATHGAMAHALANTLASSPGLSPVSLLDAGCGPGAAAFAAAAAFPSLRSLTLLDRNGPFLRLARKLAPLAAPDRAIAVLESDLAARPSFQTADLVTAGYVLTELPEAAADALVLRLWAAARMALVITEPGTPSGFARLRRARTALIAAGAHVAAPCAHHALCPMAGDAFCRVPVRIQRSRDHRALKRGALGHEDESVAYLALSRETTVRQTTHRIVGPAIVSKAGVVLPACGASGLERLEAARREPEKFRYFKKLDWGDAVEHPTRTRVALSEAPAKASAR
jgi:ribosomal protein RSM22 (predicted rRNA methylase)